MTLRLATGVFAFALLVVGVALFAPQMVDVADGNAEQKEQLTVNESTQLVEGLTLTIDEVNNASSPKTINATFSDEDRFITGNVTLLNETEAANVTLNGDKLWLTNEQVDGNYTVVTAEYTPLYYWSDGHRTFVENIGIIIVLLSVVLTIGGVFVVIQT